MAGLPSLGCTPLQLRGCLCLEGHESPQPAPGVFPISLSLFCSQGQQRLPVRFCLEQANS